MTRCCRHQRCPGALEDPRGDLESQDRGLHRILTHYLPLYFPEVDRFRQQQPQRLVLCLPRSLPDAGSITALGKEASSTAAWDVVGRKVAKARLLGDIYETARASIGLPIPIDAAGDRHVPAGPRRGAQPDPAAQRDRGAGRSSCCPRAPTTSCLRQIPGIGPINALTILAEAGDLRRFGHHRQFLKFCGLDLATHQSGTFRGQTKLSKYGNARLRRTLWMAGQVAIRQRDNSFRDKFERYIAQDRHNADLRRKALTAIAAKMARVVHAIIKSGADYRPFFEGPVPGGRTPLA